MLYYTLLVWFGVPGAWKAAEMYLAGSAASRPIVKDVGFGGLGVGFRVCGLFKDSSSGSTSPRFASFFGEPFEL